MSKYFLVLIFLTSLHSKEAKKSKRIAVSSCPGVSSESDFDSAISFAADLSATGRHSEALSCFEWSRSVARTKEQRSVATFNVAVVQKDLGWYLFLIMIIYRIYCLFRLVFSDFLMFSQACGLFFCGNVKISHRKVGHIL